MKDFDRFHDLPLVVAAWFVSSMETLPQVWRVLNLSDNHNYWSSSVDTPW